MEDYREPDKAQKPSKQKAKFSPLEWAKKLGHLRRAAPKRALRLSWEHNCAAALHQWRMHEHHAGAPIQLTQEDYEAAIAAALAPPPQTPHGAALSRYTKEG